MPYFGPTVIESDDISEALAGLGVEPGGVLFVHAGMQRALSMRGRTREEKLDTIVQGLTAAVGDGVLGMPSFSYSFCRRRGLRHRAHAVERGRGAAGVLPAAAPGVRRTTDPLFSAVAARLAAGPRGRRRCTRFATWTASVAGSVFDMLYDLNAQFLFFGVASTACTFAHYVEQRLEVPYRYHKEFRGTVRTPEGEQQVSANFYVRDLDADVETYLAPLGDDMLRSGRARASAMEGGPSLYVTDARSVVAQIEEGRGREPRLPPAPRPSGAHPPLPAAGTVSIATTTIDSEALGHEMHELATELFPITRSVAGPGLRQSLDILERVTGPMERHRFETGTPAFDWTVPREWVIRDAWIKDPGGNPIVSLGDSNLHVVSHSVPVRRRIDLDELQAHLWSLPEQPDAIPYRTSYYEERWGFCLTHDRQREALEPGEYEVCIDAELRRRATSSSARSCIPGQRDDEVLHLHLPAATRRWPTTSCRGRSSSRDAGPRCCASAPSRRGTPTGSCSCRRRSARSPTCRASASGCASAWRRATWSPASATRAPSPTSARAAATRSPTAPPSTCCDTRASATA